jgi:hypothetical protein
VLPSLLTTTTKANMQKRKAKVNGEGETHEEAEEIIRAKWQMDGATTLSEAAEKLRAFADELIQMEKDGWQLTQPVEDDYGIIYKE